MADLVFEDLVLETSQTTGTGTYALDGPQAPYRGIVAAIGTGKSAPFIVTDGMGDIECIIGTVTDAAQDTLARTKVIWSTNAGAAVSWGVGVKQVRLAFPAYMAGGQCKDVRTFDAAVTVTAKDNGVLFLGALTGNRTVNLPAGAAVWPGFTVGVLKVSGAFSATLDGNSAETIDGAATLALSTDKDFAWVTWTGAEWKITGRGDVTALAAAAAAAAAAAVALAAAAAAGGDITGCVPTNAAGDPDNDITVSAGKFKDSTGAYTLALAEITKRRDAAWSAGTGQGGRLESAALAGTIATNGTTTVTGTGTAFLTDFQVGDCILAVDPGEYRQITAIANDTSLTVNTAFGSSDPNTAYLRTSMALLGTTHVYAIYNPSTLVVDVAFSGRPSTPTDLPAGFTVFRRIGAFLIDSSADNLPMTTVQLAGGALEVLLAVNIEDVDVTNLGTSGVLYTLSTPLGIKTLAILGVVLDHATSARIYLSSPDEADAAPNVSAVPGQSLSMSSGNEVSAPRTLLRTNTSSQVRARSSASSTTLRLYLHGWIDPRI